MDASLGERFRSDGAVFVKNCLTAAQLAACEDAFAWAVANPGPMAFKAFAGTRDETHNDNANPNAKEKLDDLVSTLPFAEIFADIWGSQHVWYYAEEIFMKQGGRNGRSPWHQDTSYLPWSGQHWGNAWVSFETLPKKNALEVVRGSHRGQLYDGTSFTKQGKRLHGPDSVPALPPLPDIEAERVSNPQAYDILSWASEPGDVLLLHPRSLHGGAPVDEECPSRRTIVFRFFGDDATFQPTPMRSASGIDRDGFLFGDEMAKLQPGQPFRSPIFRQLR